MVGRKVAGSIRGMGVGLINEERGFSKEVYAYYNINVYLG